MKLLRCFQIGLLCGFAALWMSCAYPEPQLPHGDVDHAKVFELGNTQSVLLNGKEDGHHRYRVVIPQGVLTLRMSWDTPDGIARVVLFGSNELMETLLTIDRQHVALSRSVDPGQYMIEVVPGDYSTRYSIFLDHKFER